MKRAVFHSALGVLGFGLLMNTLPVEATEAQVLGVRRGSGDSPALLLRVADDAQLSVQDVAALLAAAGNRGRSAGSEQVKAAVHGRRFGEVAVLAPPARRVVVAAARKRVSPSVANAAGGSKPTARPKTLPAQSPAQPVKPDVTIFDPNDPKKPEAPPSPAAEPQEPPAPKKP